MRVIRVLSFGIRRMSFVFWMFLVMNLSAQQLTVQLTKNEFNGFKYVFTYLARADLDQSEAGRHLDNIAFQLRLSDAEKIVLRATAESYRQTINAFSRDATEQLADLQAQTRDAAVRRQAAALLQRLPPSKQEWILARFEDPSRID